MCSTCISACPPELISRTLDCSVLFSRALLETHEVAAIEWDLRVGQWFEDTVMLSATFRQNATSN